MIGRRAGGILAAGILSCTTAFSQLPSSDRIREILADRVGVENRGVGIVVGVIDATGRRVVAYGTLGKNDTRRMNGDSVFEIASVTKVFTSILLMDMARRGEVAVTDTLAKYLPPAVTVPERNGRKITLADLSTHTSGLPRMPSNFAPYDPANPYVNYSLQRLYDFLSGYQLERDIGSQYLYSNLGMGLLGHALSLRAGMSFEELVRSRITLPLGMRSTGITLTPNMRSRLVPGHDVFVNHVPNWDFLTLEGAGALRSTVNDLLIFLAANIGYTETPLGRAMSDSVSIRLPAEGPGMEIAHGWNVQSKDGKSIIWRGGSSNGYRAYIAYDPAARTGVVALSNMSGDGVVGPDDIGRHLLNPAFPLMPAYPLAGHKIPPDIKKFDRYIGTYEIAPGNLLTISRADDRFYAEVTGQRRLDIYTETDRKFFAKTDERLTFDVDARGRATHVTLHQNGKEMVAKRLR